MIAEGWLGRLGRGRAARPRGAVRASGARASGARSRGRPRRRARRIRLPNRRLLAALALLVAVLAGAWLWLRDSSLVSVRRVTVTGVKGPDAAQIRAALTRAARRMTTLDVQTRQLHAAVSAYPVVRSLQVSTEFPHGLRIRVVEEIPVATATLGGRAVALTGDGTVVQLAAAKLAQLPALPGPGGTGGTGAARVRDPATLQALAVLAAAPYQLLAKIAQVSRDPSHGLVAQLRNGPSIYFGDRRRLGAKWAVATAVLADSGSAGAAYIDVTDPDRPAAGAGAAAQSSGSSPTGQTAAAAAATAPSGAAAGTTGTPTSGTTGASASGTAGASASATAGATGTASGG